MMTFQSLSFRDLTLNSLYAYVLIYMFIYGMTTLNSLYAYVLKNI
jgi:hypothetical protein